MGNLVKIFTGSEEAEVEEDINSFICQKKVVAIAYALTNKGDYNIVILYEEGQEPNKY